MIRCSYYCALLRSGNIWYSYVPDFKVLLEVGNDKDLVQHVVSTYIANYFDRYYHKEKYDVSERVYVIPPESAIFDVMWRTKDYLRVSGLSLDNYYKNVEIFVEYEPNN